MPIPSPLEPIFKPRVRYGAMAVGITPGSVTAAASAGVVTRPVSVMAPSAITAERIYYGSWAYSAGSGGAPASTLLWPFTPAVGDVALIFGTKSNFNSFSTWPSLTDFGAPLHTGEFGAVYGRVVDGSETLSGYSVVLGASAQHVSIIVVLRGLAGLTDVGFAVQTAASSGDIVYPTITPSAAPSLIFYVANSTTGNAFSFAAAVNPGGSNPTPVQLTDSWNGSSPPQPRCVIWTGNCTSTSALGNRSVAATGMGNNYWHGLTFGVQK